ncbi:MAG: hypothetical protein IKS54_06560 [Erysipelotrichaceae bacterium]|nr:hypothetical protein [Erysipelotrichaceae bacterium]
MRTIITYESQHGSAKKIAAKIAERLGSLSINVDTPYQAEDPSKYDALIMVFNFRGPYTAQLTKLFLSKMQGKLGNKHLFLIGEGIFSEKEFPVVAKQVEDSISCASFHTFFIKGQLRTVTLTPEEQYLLNDFSKLTGMQITDMGELLDSDIEKLCDDVSKKLEELPVLEDEVKKQWICTICGYVHTGDVPPEKCPVCQQPASVFKEKE